MAVYKIKPIGISFRCGANLISSRAVIGAAHCFHHKSTSHGITYYGSDEILLSLGRHDIANWFEINSKLREVSRIFIHPDYRRRRTTTSFDADIAMVRMHNSIRFTRFIRPICLWPPDVDTDQQRIVGVNGRVVGWGSDGRGQRVTRTPRSINIPIVSTAQCLESATIFAEITSNRTFCAGRKDGYGPCHGDSGSGWAIVVNNRTTLRGLVSAALSGPLHNSCDLTNYVVFTDVAKFSEWIRRRL